VTNRIIKFKKKNAHAEISNGRKAKGKKKISEIGV
jgi:hypothetical protein